MGAGRGPKTTYSVNGGDGPSKNHENGNLTLKMDDSALENKHILNLQQKLA